MPKVLASVAIVVLCASFAAPATTAQSDPSPRRAISSRGCGSSSVEPGMQMGATESGGAE